MIHNKCLHPQLLNKILFGERILKTIEGWYEKAIQFDTNYRQAVAHEDMERKRNVEIGQKWSKGKKEQIPEKDTRVWRRETNGQNNEAALSTLTEDQRKELMKIGACFKCRKNGHLSKECPTKKEGHKQAVRKSLGQQPEQPQALRSESTQKQVERMTKEEKAELLALMKEEEQKNEEKAMTPEISLITIYNVVQAEIDRNAILLPITIESKTDKKKTIDTKALLDTGAGGKFIDQNFVLAHSIKTQKLEKPITVYNVDGTKNKTGTITRYVDLNLRIGNRTMDTQLILLLQLQYSKDNPKNINSHTNSKPSGFQVSRILRILYQRVCFKNQANVLESNHYRFRILIITP